LGLDLPWLRAIGHPNKHRRLPVALTRDEVAAALADMKDKHLRLDQLMYGT